MKTKSLQRVLLSPLALVYLKFGIGILPSPVNLKSPSFVRSSVLPDCSVDLGFLGDGDLLGGLSSDCLLPEVVGGLDPMRDAIAGRSVKSRGQRELRMPSFILRMVSLL